MEMKWWKERGELANAEMRDVHETTLGVVMEWNTRRA